MLAAADWVAVDRAFERAENVLKPLVAALLVAASLALQPAHAAERAWFSAALALCLLGDVLLLPRVDRFRSGLAAFLLAHLAFIAGLATVPLEGSVDAWPVVVAGVAVGARLLVRVPRALRIPVAVYMAALLAMFGVASATGSAVATAGAFLFLLSDTLLAWNRFIGPLPGGRVPVMVTYHLAIGLLTASLAF